MMMKSRFAAPWCLRPRRTPSDPVSAKKIESPSNEQNFDGWRALAADSLDFKVARHISNSNRSEPER